MTATPRTWADVAQHDTVRDKGGRSWLVEAIVNKPKLGKREVSLREVGSGKTAKTTVAATGTVEITEHALPALPDVDQAELAVAVVQSRIGGEVILVSEPAKDAGIPRCPPTFLHPGARLAHLYAMHGVQQPKLSTEHVHEGGPGYLDHTHDLED